ncbi:MAG: PA2169 family four-helix-bundle protein [Clostridiaceae bacterium]|nr:PA2169 family four-helix-bundle protein [Clostridiaceae bacterium]
MNDVKEMNKFLKGIHMGGTTFKDYLRKAKEPELKNELVQIIESFKRHEEAITNRIEKLGGNAADTLGVIGTMADFFEKIVLIPVNTDLEVCEHAIKAMEMGIKQGRKFIDENGSLDASLMKEVKAVVDDYDNHLRKMKEIKATVK